MAYGRKFLVSCTAESLNPLHHAGEWTRTSPATWFLTHWTTAGTPAKGILKNTIYNVCSQKSLFKIWRFFFFPLSFPHFSEECKLISFSSVLNFLAAVKKKSMLRAVHVTAAVFWLHQRCFNITWKKLCYIHKQVLVYLLLSQVFCY